MRSERTNRVVNKAKINKRDIVFSFMGVSFRKQVMQRAKRAAGCVKKTRGKPLACFIKDRHLLLIVIIGRCRFEFDNSMNFFSDAKNQAKFITRTGLDLPGPLLTKRIKKTKI